MTRTLGERSARGAAVTMAGQSVKFTVQLLSVVVLARLLTPHDYGLMAMVFVVVSAAEVIRDFGLSSAAVQAKHLSEAQRDNLFWINVTVGLLLSVVALVAADVVGALYGQPELVPMTRAMAVIFLINGAATQYRASLSRALRFKAVALSDSLPVILGVLAAVALAIAGAGYWALVAQQLVQSVVTAVLLVAAGRWVPGRPSRGAHMRALLTFGANQMGAQLINYLSRNIDNVVIGLRFGVTELGFYSRAYSLVRLPMSQISTPATTVAMPVLSRLQDQPTRFNEYVIRGQNVIVQGMSLIFGFFAAQAAPLVPLVLGSQWSPMVPFLVILAIGGIFQVASSASQWVIMARGHGGEFLKLMLLTRTLMIGLIVLGSVWGTVGVATAYSVSCLMFWMVGILWAGRVADAPVSALLRNAGIAVGGYTICSLASFGVSGLLPAADNLLRLAVGAVVMALTFGLVVLCWPQFRRAFVSALAVVRLLLPQRFSARSAKGDDA
ncbi:lipopolysaccharide biosynthesis protein [Nakamurella sp. GG22]